MFENNPFQINIYFFLSPGNVRKLFLDLDKGQRNETLPEWVKNKDYVSLKQEKQSRDSGAGVFQRILRNFKNTFFYRTPLVAASDVKPIFSIYTSWNIMKPLNF